MSVSCLETCPDCGIVLPAVQGSTHEYLGASPSCWALYGEVLAREYGDPGLMQIHRLTVDAYAAQHPGRPGRRSTQSVWVHLAGLYLTVEKGLGSDFARRVIGMLTREAEAFPWLPPPQLTGRVTVADVAAAKDNQGHQQAVQLWAADVWDAWKAYRSEIIDAAEDAARRL